MSSREVFDLNIVTTGFPREFLLPRGLKFPSSEKHKKGRLRKKVSAKNRSFGAVLALTGRGINVNDGTGS